VPQDAVGIIEGMRGLDPVSGVTGCGRPLNHMTFARMMRRLGLVCATVHGFCSAFRGWAAETTTHPNDVVELPLAHMTGSTVELADKRTDLFDRS
jgi:hypothetical protein